MKKRIKERKEGRNGGGKEKKEGRKKIISNKNKEKELNGVKKKLL